MAQSSSLKPSQHGKAKSEKTLNIANILPNNEGFDSAVTDIYGTDLQRLFLLQFQQFLQYQQSIVATNLESSNNIGSAGFYEQPDPHNDIATNLNPQFHHHNNSTESFSGYNAYKYANQNQKLISTESSTAFSRAPAFSVVDNSPEYYVSLQKDTKGHITLQLGGGESLTK